MTVFKNPHFKLPFVFGEYVEQDHLDDVAQCVEAILRTEQGDRLALPEFGLVDGTFTEGGVDLEEIKATILEWEPRAEVLLERRPELLEELVDRIRIEVRERNLDA